MFVEQSDQLRGRLGRTYRGGHDLPVFQFLARNRPPSAARESPSPLESVSFLNLSSARLKPTGLLGDYPSCCTSRANVIFR
jgi:hypothetical protein